MYKERSNVRWWQSKYNLGMVVLFSVLCILTMLVFIITRYHMVKWFEMCAFVGIVSVIYYGGFEMFIVKVSYPIVLPRLKK